MEICWCSTALEWRRIGSTVTPNNPNSVKGTTASGRLRYHCSGKFNLISAKILIDYIVLQHSAAHPQTCLLQSKRLRTDRNPLCFPLRPTSIYDMAFHSSPIGRTHAHDPTCPPIPFYLRSQQLLRVPTLSCLKLRKSFTFPAT